MKLKQVLGAIMNMLLRLTISCVVVIFVYRMAMYSYHFGYMVFNDAAREPSPGRDITIAVEMEDSVLDIGKTLESRGLIEDSKIFVVQELLSEYHKKLQPGIYTLNTSMKASEMLAVMGENSEDAEETDDAALPQANLLQDADPVEADTQTQQTDDEETPQEAEDEPAE